MYWIVRTHSDPRSFVTRFQRAIRDVDPTVATSSMQTLDELIAASLGAWRTNVQLLELFGQVAVGLALLGVYAVPAFSASTRRRELTIRATLGASEHELTRLVLREEMVPVLIGLAAGMCVAFVMMQNLGAMLFQTSPSDPLTYGGIAGAMLVAAALASYVPTRRAGRCDPAQLLRV
jgi:putative ABC transport system permease protein